MRLFLFILTSVLILPTSGRSEENTFQKYLNLGTRNAARLTRKFPPDRYFILNFGHTTAVTGAYFRWTLPTEAARKDYYTELMLERARRLSSTRWNQIFDQVLPSDEVLRGRTLIIHRYLWTGLTAQALFNQLLEYRSIRRPHLKIGALVVTSVPNTAPLPSWLNPAVTLNGRANEGTIFKAIDIFGVLRARIATFADSVPVDAQYLLGLGAQISRPNLHRAEIVPAFWFQRGGFQLAQPQATPSVWDNIYCELLLFPLIP